MTATTPSQPPLNIAIVTCSSRKPRLNPYVSEHVYSILAPLAASNPRPITLNIIDLAAPEHTLPLIMDDPTIPAQLPSADPTPHYAQPATRAWSATVAQHAAFVFVTPQYNWSFPATLKVALDALFYEWVGKAAVVVTYGGKRAGNKAGEQLRSVLGGGLRMKLVPEMPEFACREGLLGDATRDGKIDDAQKGLWEDAGGVEGVKRVWGELVALLEAD